jgi:hypothetical protein
VSEQSTKPAPFLPRAIGRLGLYATYVAAALLTLVIAGDVGVLTQQAPLVGWLALLVGMGPLVALLLSTLAGYANYYGVWRIARGKDEYDAGQDLKSHAADVPQAAQAMLANRAGCLPAASTMLLVLTLLVVLANDLPPQTPLLGALATWSGGQPEPTATPTLTATPTPTDTPTPTPTPIPLVIKFAIAPTTASWSCLKQGTQVGAQTITLDNSGSNINIIWNASAVEKDTAGNAWAVITPGSGTVSAAGTQPITISPNPQFFQLGAVELCRMSGNGKDWHVTFAAEGAGTYTFAYTIGP